MHNPATTRCPICLHLLECEHSEALRVNAALAQLSDRDFVAVDEPSEFALMLIEDVK
jgi:hypothetical protein